MKRNIIKLLLCGGLVTGSFLFTSAQVYVNVRPVAPAVVVERPARPTPTHVWVGEEWVPDGPHYRYVAAHWEAPPRAGVTWHPGHWVHDKRRGHYWVAGAWR